MKIKNFWEKQYFGFLAFAVGLGFLLLAKLLTFFLLLGFLCFLGGAVYNMVITFKLFKNDNDEINMKLAKIEQVLDEENEKATDQQILVNNQVLEKLEKDANILKFKYAMRVILYLAVSVLSILFFINACFIL